MNISSILHNNLFLTRRRILYKQEIINLHNIFSIDYLLDLHSYFICFCTQNNIHNFINDANNLSIIYNRQILGIYVGYIKLDKNQESLFNKNNNYNNYFIDIISFNDNKINKKINKILYSHGIYYYDNSGDCIMIDV